MRHVWETGEVHIGFLGRKPEGEKDHFENVGVNGRIILKWIKQWDVCMELTDLVRMGTVGGIL